MTTPAKKTPAKKTTDRTPGEAAAAETVPDDDALIVHFRGEEFTIKSETRTSARFALAIAANNNLQMIYELIADDDVRFMSLLKRGESFVDVAIEFFAAFGEATGEGNS